MSCCQCKAIEEFHNPKAVKSELSRYRKKGPDNPTRKLITAIQKEGNMVSPSSISVVAWGAFNMRFYKLE